MWAYKLCAKLKQNERLRVEFEITLINWSLVGTGEAYPTCGQQNYISVRCTESGEGHTRRELIHDCHRLSCPIDFKAEVWRRSKEAADRIAFAKREYYLAGIESDYVEVIIYPPRDKADWCFGTVEGYEWMKQAIRQIHVDFGVLGGLQFTHMTAVNRHEGAGYEEYEKLRKGQDSRVRHNPHVQEVALRRLDWGRERTYTVDSLGRRRATKDKMAEWQRKGWFVRVLYADGRTGNREWNSVAKKIAYEMGHAYQGVTETGNKKAFTTYFGICGYNNLRRKVDVVKEPELCKCGRQCYLYFEDERREEAYIKRKEFTYWLHKDAVARATRKYRLVPGELRSEKLTPFLEWAET